MSIWCLKQQLGKPRGMNDRVTGRASQRLQREGEGLLVKRGVPSWMSSRYGILGPRAQLTGSPRVQRGHAHPLPWEALEGPATPPPPAPQASRDLSSGKEREASDPDSIRGQLFPALQFAEVGAHQTICVKVRFVCLFIRILYFHNMQ